MQKSLHTVLTGHFGLGNFVFASNLHQVFSIVMFIVRVRRELARIIRSTLNQLYL